VILNVRRVQERPDETDGLLVGFDTRLTGEVIEEVWRQVPVRRVNICFVEDLVSELPNDMLVVSSVTIDLLP
jgi:hypothetical protein